MADKRQLVSRIDGAGARTVRSGLDGIAVRLADHIARDVIGSHRHRHPKGAPGATRPMMPDDATGNGDIFNFRGKVAGAAIDQADFTGETWRRTLRSR